MVLDCPSYMRPWSLRPPTMAKKAWDLCERPYKEKYDDWFCLPQYLNDIILSYHVLEGDGIVKVRLPVLVEDYHPDIHESQAVWPEGLEVHIHALASRHRGSPTCPDARCVCILRLFRESVLILYLSLPWVVNVMIDQIQWRAYSSI